MKLFYLKKLLVCCIAFSIIVLSLTACNENESKYAKTIIDSSGEEIILTSEPNRVICVSQNALEFMVAMGEREHLIGVHKSIFDHTWSKEYINDLDALEGFGYSPSAEAVFNSNADLVIVKNASTAEELRNVGINAVTFFYNNEDELFSSVKFLGEIFGEDATSYAEKWINYYNETATTIREKTSTLEDEEQLDTYFIDASVGLDAGGLYTTVGENSIVSDWFDIIGVDLITEGLGVSNSINEEKILELDPDSIIIGGWSENRRMEELYNDVKWEDISAVKNDKVYLTPVGFISFERYGVAAPLLLKYSANQIYPEKYEYDAIEDFGVFFEEFYNITVPEEKIQYMLEGLSPDGSRMD